MANVVRVVIANAVWRSVSNKIASVTMFHRNDKNRAISVELVRRWPHRAFSTARNDKPHAKTKTLHKTQFSKIKTHLKLSSKSVGQGRGGLEGTVRPSQLRAGSSPKKRTPKKISPRGRQNPHE